jgi:hypothetical protein
MQKQKAFALPNAIDRYLAALSKLYAQNGRRDLQELVVNAQVRVHEEWNYDGLDGGIWGHALYLTVPEAIFLRLAKQKNEVQEDIRSNFNSLHNFLDEYIAAVFVEMDVPDDSDWRQESGLLIVGRRDVPAAAVKRIWEESGRFRVFLSHKASVKKEVADLKEQLCSFGFSAFVAHADIHPTKDWREEIENALATMDGFVALMTEDFHESDWTDQEVGYALARGVPMLNVRLGRDPYGLIGKFQAVSTRWETAALDIAKMLIKHDRALSSYIHALRDCPNWNSANTLAEVLPGIEKLSTKQVDDLVEAYNENGELRGGWGFNGSRPASYGPGLVHHLNLHGDRKFKFGTHRIELA